MAEATKEIGQWNSKGAANDCFLFKRLFASKRLEKPSMDIGFEIIGIVINNKKYYIRTPLII